MYDPVSPMLRRDAASALQPEAKSRFAEDRLLDAVIWCDTLPGETVTEADVMTRFGLTRAAARVALTRLGHDGWAEPQPRAGWRIMPVTGALIGDIFTARRLIEPALGQVRPAPAQIRRILSVCATLAVIDARREAAAAAARRRWFDEIDGLLLGAVNALSARHIRKLWHHTARIIRFLEEPEAGVLFHRKDAPALARALSEGGADEMISARMSLIADQESFVFSRLLKSKAPLSPSGRVDGRIYDEFSAK